MRKKGNKGKILACLIIAGIFQGCTNKMNSKRDTVKDNQHSNTNMEGKRFSKVSVKFLPDIFTKSIVRVVSTDSILVRCTFYNTSKTDFYLYKPLLPIDNYLTENVFRIGVESIENEHVGIDFIKHGSELLYEGSAKSVFYVKPVLKAENFIKLGAGDTLSVEVNIANFYDFKSFVQKGHKRFSIAYNAAMPLIDKQYSQAFEVVKGEGSEKKPVFVIVGTPKAAEDQKYLSEVFYFTID